jgi:ABC-2 type transport system permease protein
MAACLVAGFRPTSLVALPLGLAVMLLVATLFSAVGMTIGATLKNMQGFQLIMTFLVMPTYFLSGAVFPLSNLPAPLAVVTRLDPLSYGVDGLRGVLIGRTEFGIATDLAVLSAVAVLFLMIGAWRFSKIEV